MIIDHVKTWRDSLDGKKWHDASSQEWFHRGIQLALSSLYLPPAQDMGQAAASHWRREGAEALAVRLVTLTEVQQPKPAPAMKTLLPV